MTSYARFYGPALKSFVGIVLFLMLLPIVVICVVAFTPTETLSFPPTGFSVRWFEAYLSSPDWINATKNSLFIAAGATVISTAVGGIAATVIDRLDFRFSNLLGASYVVPIMLPPIVISVAFVSFFYTLNLTGSVWGVILAHSVFFVPFPFILISQGLGEFDRSYEEASMILGEGKLGTFRRVTFPIIKANALAGAIFVFILSLNEYVIAWLLAGFSIKTVPIKVFAGLRYSYSPLVASASVVIILITAVLALAVDYATGGIWE